MLRYGQSDLVYTILHYTSYCKAINHIRRSCHLMVTKELYANCPLMGNSDTRILQYLHYVSISHTCCADETGHCDAFERKIPLEEFRQGIEALISTGSSTMKSDDPFDITLTRNGDTISINYGRGILEISCDAKKLRPHST
jgi:hypothetical protein